MNLLAIECSCNPASLCLCTEEEGVCTRAEWSAERNHDAYLFPALQQALDTLGERPLHTILVGAGPGSYGGVRVALAAGVGIALVRGAQLVALDSWAHLSQGKLSIISDARRGGWTLRHPDGRIEVLSTAQLTAWAEPLATVEAPGVVAAKTGVHPQQEGLHPTAEGLVAQWLHMSAEERAAAAAKAPEPIYVRPPHITDAQRKPWEIKH